MKGSCALGLGRFSALMVSLVAHHGSRGLSLGCLRDFSGHTNKKYLEVKGDLTDRERLI